MKNKYLKGSHISEKKMSELLLLFCEDHTATEIAGITGISRITANAYLKLLRSHIAAFCEERNLAAFTNGHGNISGNGDYTAKKKGLFGICVTHDFVYTTKLEGSAYQSACEQLIKNKPGHAEMIALNADLRKFQGIIDLNTSTLLPVKQPDREQPDVPESQQEETERFWNMLRARIVKFRGLNTSTLYLHVKETEFRYNYRNENIYGLLLGIIQKKPLHLSRA
ncbi:MAG: hypothetical protein ABI687_12685 [Flavitalea sp.]